MSSRQPQQPDWQNPDRRAAAGLPADQTRAARRAYGQAPAGERMPGRRAPPRVLARHTHVQHVILDRRVCGREADARAAVDLVRKFGDYDADPEAAMDALAAASLTVTGMALVALSATGELTLPCRVCGQESEHLHDPVALFRPRPRLVQGPVGEQDGEAQAGSR